MSRPHAIIPPLGRSCRLNHAPPRPKWDRDAGEVGQDPGGVHRSLAPLGVEVQQRPVLVAGHMHPAQPAAIRAPVSSKCATGASVSGSRAMVKNLSRPMAAVGLDSSGFVTTL